MDVPTRELLKTVYPDVPIRAELPGFEALLSTAKARALLHQRYAVVAEDIHAMALPVLRHRVLLNFKAEAEHITSDDVTRHLVKAVERPGGRLK